MNNRPHLDLTTDWLEDAPLSPDQRQAWNQLRDELKQARHDLHETKSRLKELEESRSEEDFAHAVLSRPDFNREVARMIAFDERYGGQSSLVYFDLDNIKELISAYGRPKVDTAIQTLCLRLSDSVRSSDIIGRISSDEFGLFLVRCNNDMAWSRGEEFAALIQACLTETLKDKTAPHVSYGAYSFGKEGKNVSDGLKEAASNVTK